MRQLKPLPYLSIWQKTILGFFLGLLFPLLARFLYAWQARSLMAGPAGVGFHGILVIDAMPLVLGIVSYRFARQHTALTQALLLNRAIIGGAPYAIVSMDPQGIVTTFNAAAERMFGFTAEEMISKANPGMWHDDPEAIARAADLTEKLGKRVEPGIEMFLGKALTGGVEESEWTYRRKDGTQFPAHLSLSQLAGPGGGVAGYLGICRDLTVEKAAEEALRNREADLRLLADNMSDLVCVHEPEGAFLSVSPSSRRILGYEPEELIGTDPYRLFHPNDTVRIREESHVQVLAGKDHVCVVYRMLTKSGNYLWLESITRPILNDQGSVVRLLCASRDVSERMNAQAELRDSEERLRLALQTARMGTWDWDLVRDQVQYSEQIASIYGLPSDVCQPDRTVLRATCHPDDRERATQAVRESVETGSDLDVEVRIVQPDGGIRWLAHKGHMYPDVAGKPSRMIGVTHDITDLKSAIGEAVELTTVLENAVEGISRFDAHGRHVHANHAYATMTGYTPEEMIGLDWTRTIHEDDRARMADVYQKMVDTGKVTAEARGLRKDGSGFHKQVVMISAFDRSGQFSGNYCFMKDISERKDAEQKLKDYNVVLEFQKGELESTNAQLEALATTDGQTGLKNHRAFQERLAQEVNWSERSRIPLSLVILDVDHFKQYNDSYGHPAGDDVLREVAEILRSTVRDTDLVARYGGEEFAVIMSNSGEVESEIAAERIRLAIAGANWSKRAITVSVGVTTRAFRKVTVSEMIMQADQALYRAKFQGRNRACHSRTLQSPECMRLAA